MLNHDPIARSTITRPIMVAVAASLLGLAGCQLDSRDARSAPAPSAAAMGAAAAQPAPTIENHDLPRTADAAERWLQNAAQETCVLILIARSQSLPHSADAAEHWFQNCST